LGSLLVSGIICEEQKEQKYTLQTNSLNFLYNIIFLGIPGGYFQIDLEGQYKINEIVNMSLTTGYLYRHYPNYEPHYYVNHFLLKPMFIFRLNKTGLKGFYLGIYSNMGLYTDTHMKQYGDKAVFLLGAGFDAGYKWIYKNGFTIQLSTGFGKTLCFPEANYYPTSPDLRFLGNYGDLQIINLKLGYSF